MTLIVDFNMTTEEGLVPAVVPRADASLLHSGDKVLAVDGEGTECQTEVVEIIENERGVYALLSPIGGTWRTDSKARFSPRDLFV